MPSILETRKINNNNTSGVRGVSYRKNRGKWRAYIKIKRKNIHLGNFDTKEDAIAARKAAEEKWFGPYRDSH
ncbi:MAG TPA: AP2 domain-containing protein [Candidatus Blautia faecavium]|uniref:AP2 domain-containing protein n=1 Tax=Candidatus Blautia faecavium TaxID=2838487 RepID=A0A9D2LRN4_9FIRM|nr:AP2 domain-containing protein [Candidatus Blautia faecavium]